MSRRSRRAFRRFEREHFCWGFPDGSFAFVPASVDTLPKGGDAKQAPCESKGSAGGSEADETPNPDNRTSRSPGNE
jgi:hypothetical protein